MNEQGTGNSGNNLLSFNVPGIYYSVNLSQNSSHHHSPHLVSDSCHQLSLSVPIRIIKSAKKKDYKIYTLRCIPDTVTTLEELRE